MNEDWPPQASGLRRLAVKQGAMIYNERSVKRALELKARNEALAEAAKALPQGEEGYGW